jgi:hypothetical protein
MLRSVFHLLTRCVTRKAVFCQPRVIRITDFPKLGQYIEDKLTCLATRAGGGSMLRVLVAVFSWLCAIGLLALSIRAEIVESR